jgi:Ca2+-transporting ATPase
VIQGGLALLGVGAVYVIALRAEMPADEARALAFVALIGANIALILASRTFGGSMLASLTRPNASLVWGFALVAAALAIVLGWPTARGFFGLGPLHVDDLLVCLSVALGLLWLLGVVKRLCGVRIAEGGMWTS